VSSELHACTFCCPESTWFRGHWCNRIIHLLVLVIPGTVALGILAAASSTHHSIMSSFCCAVKPLNQALAVCVLQEILGRNHSPGFYCVRIHALSIGAFTVVVKTSCLFTLPNPPTCTVLHFLWRRFASGLLIIFCLQMILPWF
jgi:hypothetical protein